MDCKDLMVGDWVNIKGKSVKVTLDDLRTMLILFEDVDFHIEPISLTEEILVKNGFERCDYNNKYFIINDVINLITPKWRGVTEYYACAWYQDEFDDFVQHIEICKCAYIHQLQRLLRLCGMEKELII